MGGGLVPHIGAATDRHQTDQNRFYLCCGYTGVGAHFVQRIVTSNMTEKNRNDRNFCRQLGQLTEVKFKKKNSIERILMICRQHGTI